MSLLRAAATSAAVMGAGDMICQAIQARKPVAEAKYVSFCLNIVSIMFTSCRPTDVSNRRPMCDAQTAQVFSHATEHAGGIGVLRMDYQMKSYISLSFCCCLGNAIIH